MNSNNVFTEEAYKIKPSSSLIRKINTKKKKWLILMMSRKKT